VRGGGIDPRRGMTMRKLLVLLLLIALGIAPAVVLSVNKPVRMAYLQNDIHHLALWVALEKGFFAHEKVDVEISGIFRAGPEVMTAFAAGGLDMAYVGEAPATTAVANKACRVVVVAQVNTEGSALVVATGNAGIGKLSDLGGKTVAIPGHSTVQDFLLKKALKKEGVDLSRVNVIVLKPPEMINALRTAEIDAFIAWEPYPSQAATMGLGRKLATSRQMWSGHPCCVLVCDSVFLDANLERVRGVIRAHVRATAFIKEHPEEAVRIGVKYTGMDAETVRTAMDTVHYTHELNIEGEKEYVQFLSELNYIRVESPQYFIEQFIDGEPLKSVTQK